MRRINSNELKKIELDLLKNIHNICVNHNMRYSLAYGTLLGAIRHKGFIPWDDDIDICMPRPDYNRFVEYCASHKTPFRLLAAEANVGYADLISKVCALNTVIKEESTNRFGEKTGVYVDLFPIEGLGNTLEEGRSSFGKSSFARELLNAALWKKYFRSKTHAWFYEPLRFALFCLSRPVSPYKLVDKITQSYKNLEYDKMDYVGVVGSPYREKDIFKKEILDGYIDVEFEGETFKGFAKYDDYLKQIYGEYRKLPPKEKRVTHHTFRAYYLKP